MNKKLHYSVLFSVKADSKVLSTEYSSGNSASTFFMHVGDNFHFTLHLHSQPFQADQFSDFHIRSVLCVPIWNSNHQIIGKLTHIFLFSLIYLMSYDIKHD